MLDTARGANFTPLAKSLSATPEACEEDSPGVACEARTQVNNCRTDVAPGKVRGGFAHKVVTRVTVPRRYRCYVQSCQEREFCLNDDPFRLNSMSAWMEDRAMRGRNPSAIQGPTRSREISTAVSPCRGQHQTSDWHKAINPIINVPVPYFIPPIASSVNSFACCDLRHRLK